jgi:hypothetical protein
MPFFGTASNSEGPVGAGLNAFMMQDGRLLDWIAGLTVNQDFELEGIRTCGQYGDRFFKSLGYTASFQMETFVIRGQNVPGALYKTGFLPNGNYNANTTGEFDFTVVDTENLTVLYSMLRAKMGGSDIAFPARGLNTDSTNWRCTRVVPGLFTS